ncbi:secreted RxLR effector protein 161-like [Apium graveolens]|uniref:secreted RxLR effector protein 161-like n=1 Tax=Apium graveolens TaxID=4045 RepID=UPI003D7BC02C
MSEEFKIKDMGTAKQIHAMSIRRDRAEGEKEFSKVPYASAVGSLMYAMVCTRPDIAHAVRVKWFSDANFGGYLDMRKSTTGYILTLGGTAISWMSRIQKSVALSTTEAEYMAISEARRR